MPSEWSKLTTEVYSHKDIISDEDSGMVRVLLKSNGKVSRKSIIFDSTEALVLLVPVSTPQTGQTIEHMPGIHHVSGFTQVIVLLFYYNKVKGK